MTELSVPFEITITQLVFGGDGMGRLPDGRAVFVPFVLPGERARARAVEEKRGFVRAALIEVLEPSPQRIVARCPHFGVCGGCQYQHLPYSLQLEVKRQLLAEQLERIGGIANPPVEPVRPSPSEWYYRNTVQFHLAEDGHLGYHAAGSHQVIPIQVCFLPEELVNETWPQLEFEPGTGLERVGLRGGSDEQVLLVLESENPEPLEFATDLPLSAVYLGPEGEIVLAGDDSIVTTVLGRPFRISAGSFFQVNTPQAEAMVTHLLERVELTPGSTVFDVYCGVGLFSAFMAPRVGQVVGIELSPPACEDFAVNLDEFDNVSLYQGAAEEVLPALDQRPDVVVVDPPRAGLDHRVLDAITDQGSRQLAYISCDPATLARDLKRLLAAGYRLVNITPFDLFPQTGHIETVVILSR